MNDEDWPQRAVDAEEALRDLEAANDAMAAAIPAPLYNALTDGVPGIGDLRDRLDAARRTARAVLADRR